MPLSRAVDVPPPRVVPSGAHALVTALLVAVFWFDVLWESARQGPHASLPPLAVAFAGLASQMASCAFEGAAARAAWQALGHTPSWLALAARVLAVSSAEAFAVSIAAGGTVLPSWLAQLLAGPRAAPLTLPDTGLAHAFASFGVLTVARLVLSAHAQARLVGVAFRRGFALVLAFYLAMRLVMWWSSDLAQGRSFQPWG